MGRFLLFLFVGLIGCTSQEPKDPNSVSKNKYARFPLESVEKQEIQELTIARNDPSSGDIWTARFVQPTASNPTSNWWIDSGPSGTAFRDRWANSTFIDHLLSTFQTLEFKRTEPVPAGVLLERTGLLRPTLAIRFFSNKASYEIRLGFLNPQTRNYWAKIKVEPKLSPATEHPTLAFPESIGEVSGATVGLLDHVRSFETFRLKKLVPGTLDAIYQVRLEQKGQLLFFAQRVFGEWRDQKGTATYQTGFSDWLERLTHLQVVTFLEAPPPPPSQATLTVTFLDREDQPTKLHFFKTSGKPLIASVSSRTGSSMTLDASAWEWVTRPPQNKAKSTASSR